MDNLTPRDNVIVIKEKYNTAYGWQMQGRAVKWGAVSLHMSTEGVALYEEAQLCEGSCPF